VLRYARCRNIAYGKNLITAESAARQNRAGFLGPVVFQNHLIDDLSTENAPEPGNIHLFAPTGVVDAREARVAENNLFVGARIVVLGDCSRSGTSIGPPSSSTTTPATLAPTRVGTPKAMEEFIARFANVEVIGFEEEKSDERN
jgi:hypothetical protein